MITMSVSIDVPSLEKGVGFYSAAFGFSKVAEPYPGVIVLRAGDMSICLLEKAPGSKPSPNTQDARGYQRHWTPVHLDFHVESFSEAVDRAVAAGAVVEQRFENPEHGSAAFCSDPFGHGFCLIERVR
jgi:predicted enzyme related to lactoylglutathione lyase